MALLMRLPLLLWREQGGPSSHAPQTVSPLNTDAWDAIVWLYKRAEALGEVRPEHYVFPACEASHFDPTRPQKSWRTAWRNLTRLIQCPACGAKQAPGRTCSNAQCRADIEKIRSRFTRLRFHDLRHHAITELAESQASDSTIMSIAGHVSQKMLQHYSHVRLQAKREALDALSKSRPKPVVYREQERGYVTKPDTNHEELQDGVPQLLEKMVELVGIEPTTSSLRTMRSAALI